MRKKRTYGQQRVYLQWGKTKEIQHRYRDKIKRNVLTHYGNGRCACIKCGFDDLRALSIDHINGGGAEHRRSVAPGGYVFYMWLIRNNFPEGYQTLCMNCQWIKK